MEMSRQLYINLISWAPNYLNHIVLRLEVVLSLICVFNGAFVVLMHVIDALAHVPIDRLIFTKNFY